MGPIVDQRDVANDACARDCQESSGACTWPNCSCPATQTQAREPIKWPAWPFTDRTKAAA